MSIADIVISVVTWIVQKIILPVLPTDIPFFSLYDYRILLEGTMRHNFIYGLAGLDNFINLNLFFNLILIIITAEILFWLIKAGFFLIKLVRGGG